MHCRLKFARNALLPVVMLIAALTFVSAPVHACQTPDKDAAVAKVLSDHPGGKILKVEEKKSKSNSCSDLKIRVLVNGTVKLVVIKGR